MARAVERLKTKDSLVPETLTWLIISSQEVGARRDARAQSLSSLRSYACTPVHVHVCPSAPAPSGRASRAAWHSRLPLAPLAGFSSARMEHAERPFHANSIPLPAQARHSHSCQRPDGILCLCSLPALCVSVHVALCLSRSATSLWGWRTERPWRPPHPSRPPPDRLGAWQTWRRPMRSRPRRWRAARRGRRG